MIIFFTLLCSLYLNVQGTPLTNSDACNDLCSLCNGFPNFENGKCRCIIPRDQKLEEECALTMFEKSNIIDFLSCDLSKDGRSTRCIPTNRFSTVLGKNNIEKVANYFEKGGPLTTSIFKEKCVAVQKTTPQPEINLSKKITQPKDTLLENKSIPDKFNSKKPGKDPIVKDISPEITEEQNANSDPKLSQSVAEVLKSLVEVPANLVSNIFRSLQFMYDPNKMMTNPPSYITSSTNPNAPNECGCANDNDPTVGKPIVEEQLQRCNTCHMPCIIYVSPKDFPYLSGIQTADVNLQSPQNYEIDTEPVEQEKIICKKSIDETPKQTTGVKKILESLNNEQQIHQLAVEASEKEYQNDVRSPKSVAEKFKEKLKADKLRIQSFFAISTTEKSKILPPLVPISERSRGFNKRLKKEKNS